MEGDGKVSENKQPLLQLDSQDALHPSVHITPPDVGSDISQSRLSQPHPQSQHQPQAQPLSQLQSQHQSQLQARPQAQPHVKSQVQAHAYESKTSAISFNVDEPGMLTQGGAVPLEHHPIELWTTEEVIRGLCADPMLSEIESWKNVFRQHHINGTALLTLDDKVISETLQIASYGIRMKIVSIIKGLKRDREQKAERRVFTEPDPQPGELWSRDVILRKTPMFLVGLSSLATSLCFIAGGAIYYDISDRLVFFLSPDEEVPETIPKVVNDYFAGVTTIGAFMVCTSILSLIQTKSDVMIDWHQLLSLSYFGLFITQIVAVAFGAIEVHKLGSYGPNEERAYLVNEVLSAAAFGVVYFGVILVIRALWQVAYRPLFLNQQASERSRRLLLISVETTTILMSVLYLAGSSYQIYYTPEGCDDFSPPEICRMQSTMDQINKATVAVGCIGIVACCLSVASPPQKLMGHIPLVITYIGFIAVDIAYLSAIGDFIWDAINAPLPRVLVLEYLSRFFTLFLLGASVAINPVPLDESGNIVSLQLSVNR